MSACHPAQYLFSSFPREASIPQRVGLLRTFRDLAAFVNAHNGRTNVYVSAFSYARLRDERKPDYSSARIDFVPLDFDGLPQGIHDAFRMHEWLLREGIEHATCFSGGGLHAFVRADPPVVRLPAAAINGAQKHLERRAFGGLAPSLHPAPGQEGFFGDVARCIRVPGTWNLKRRRWDVMLTLGELEALEASADNGLEPTLASLLPRPRPLAAYVEPGDPLDLSAWDDERFLPERPKVEMAASGLEGGLEDSGIPIVIRSPVIAKSVHPEMNNEERGRLLFYLFGEGYTLGEVLRFLRETLSKKRFHHCVYQERQPQRMFERLMR